MQHSRVLESIRNSFKAELTSSGKEQLRIFKAFICGRYRESVRTKKYYAALMALCQSSGNGKSKLCFELLASLPGIMTVFREANADPSAYPIKSKWTDLFLTNIMETDNDAVVGIQAELAVRCNVGRCLICLLQLILEYRRLLEEAPGPVQEFFLSVRDKILRNEGFLDSSFNLQNYSETVVANVIHEIEENLLRIADLCPGPFVLVFDEAQVLLSHKTFQGTDAFSILRRALHLLPPETNLMAVVVGTSSTIADFHPIIGNESLCFPQRKELIPPYILCENWDILYDYRQLAGIPITPQFLLDKRTAQFLVSLGRPGWCAIVLEEVVSKAVQKLNYAPDSEDSKLVHILLRAAVNSAPDSQLSKTLVKSYMASLISVTKNTNSLKVEFCSEPVLAMASRALTSTPDGPAKVFQSLLKAVQNNVVDRGRILESVMFYICLLAGDTCERAPRLVASETVAEPEYLRPVYEHQAFLLQRQVHGAESRTRAARLESNLYAHYHVFTLTSFLESLFPELTRDLLSDFLPAPILQSLLNFSHFLPTLKSFPVAQVWPDEATHLSERIPDAWRRKGRGNHRTRSLGVNWLSESLLKFGLQRQCAFIAPPGYYGLDATVPVMLPDGKIFYLGIQVKMNVDDCLVPICKMAAQCHFLACLRHGNEDCECEQRTGPDNVAFIKNNQVSLMLCAAPVYQSRPNSIRTKLPHTHESVASWAGKLKIQPKGLKLSKEVKATGMAPDLVVERELSPGLRIIVLYWNRYQATHTCFFASGFNNFKVMTGLEEVALNIIRFYDDPFGDIDAQLDSEERKRSYQEIGNRVLKRSVGKYPNVDATIRARAGLPDLPPVPDYFPT